MSSGSGPPYARGGDPPLRFIDFKEAKVECGEEEGGGGSGTAANGFPITFEDQTFDWDSKLTLGREGTVSTVGAGVIVNPVKTGLFNPNKSGYCLDLGTVDQRGTGTDEVHCTIELDQTYTIDELSGRFVFMGMLHSGSTPPGIKFDIYLDGVLQHSYSAIDETDIDFVSGTWNFETITGSPTITKSFNQLKIRTSTGITKLYSGVYLDGINFITNTE